MEIVLRELDLRMIEPDVGVIGKGQADAVVQREHQLSIRGVILQALRRKERRSGLLAATESEQPLQARRVLRDCRRAKRHHQSDQGKQGTEHFHRSPPRDSFSDDCGYSYRIASTGSSRAALTAG